MLETGSFHEQLVSLVSSEEKTAGKHVFMYAVFN